MNNKLDLVVEGNGYINGKLTQCCIGIKDGKIEKIKKVLCGDEHLDFGYKIILPAGIDSHVHFRDPGQTHKEDFASGTISGAFGGICCILDMPNTIPLVNSYSTFLEKYFAIQKKAFIDYGLFATIKNAIEENTFKEIEILSKQCIGFKIYMATTTNNLILNNVNILKLIIEVIQSENKVIAFHAEDESLIQKREAKNLFEHLNSRPCISEESAIQKLKSLETNAKLHICHISCKESLAQLRNSNFTSEVTPHHLFLHSKLNLGAFGKVNPPLRTKDDRFALWQALNNGIIDIIASDHAPHTIEEKEDFSTAPSGMPGVETTFPIMLSMLKHNKISLSRLVNAICEKPAEIYGLNKGKIKEGYDADLIVVDMQNENKILDKYLHSKCEWTPYNGFNAIFPKALILRGKIIVQDQNFLGEKGYGKLQKANLSNN